MHYEEDGKIQIKVIDLILKIENKITRITRQKIAGEIDIANIALGGRLNYADFLNRIFDLKSLPSYDP